MSRVSSRAVACAMLASLVASPAAAGLLAPATGSGTSLRGVGSVRKLVVDRAALTRLRSRSSDTVRDFPLGDRGTVDLELERFDPFTPGARAEVEEAGGRRRLRLPDNVYFRGTVAGDPASHVFLVAAKRSVHGFVISDGEVFPFGPDARGGHRSYALRNADPTVYPPPGNFCENDLHAELVNPSAREAADVLVPPVAGAPAAPGTIKQASVAIETDQELRAKFTSDSAALNYLASLAAAASSIYERDVAVRVRFSYIRLWGAAPADPWTATDPSGTLTELRSYWNNSANGMAGIAGPRTVVHFVSGKPVQGGVAYLNVLCSASFGYGVSQVRGSFDLSRPSQIWDVMVVSHELGHNFGSPHTHCYSPPVDRCYNGESGCYAGSVVASRGTVMSYCHQLSGGLGNIDLVFGDVVSARIDDSVAAAGCLATVPVSTTTSSTTSPPTTSTTTQPPTTTTSVAATTSTTSSTSTSSTTTRPPTSSTTTRPPATSTTTTTSTTSSTSTTTRSVTTSTTSTSPATTTTLPGTTDPPCPCAGPSPGNGWASHAAYVRCVQAALAQQVQAGALSRPARRATLERARRSSCGRADVTRCCVFPRPGDSQGKCRVMPGRTCTSRVAAGRGLDLGPGSCEPAACTR